MTVLDDEVERCPHTLVAVVTQDGPFLVDSLQVAFSRLGIGVHLIVHPIFDVQRDRAGRLVSINSAAGHRESGSCLKSTVRFMPSGCSR